MLFSLPRTYRSILLAAIALIALLALFRLPTSQDVETWKAAIPKIDYHKYLPSSLSWSSLQGHFSHHTEPSHKPDEALIAVESNVFSGARNATETAPCQALQGGGDVLVVLRTGASEIEDRVPVHLETTFLCYPHTLIFSDYAEDDFHGHKIWNVLADMDDDVVENNGDFEYYRRLQQYGRISLKQEELAGKMIDEGTGVGKDDNLGWRLDKWKFLPMMNMTLNLEPDKKWYVFVEPDSYLVWSNLLQWLAVLDPSKPGYYGSEVLIGDDAFAHGGSVWVLSKPALERVAKIYVEKKSQWNELLSGSYWAGDCMLGRALNDTGVPITNVAPMMQGDSPAAIGFDNMDAWCAPALTYHHVRDDEVRTLWELEQDWIRAVRGLPLQGTLAHIEKKQKHAVLSHRDIFAQLMLPTLTAEREHWDNRAEILMEGTEMATMEECRDFCEYNEGCKLFSIGPFGCSLSYEVKLGQPRDDVRSGWLTDRIHEWMDDQAVCDDKSGWTRVEPDSYPD